MTPACAVIVTPDLGASVTFCEPLLAARTTVQTAIAALLVGPDDDRLVDES